MLEFYKDFFLKYSDDSIDWCFFVFCLFLPLPHTTTVKSIAKVAPIVIFAIKLILKKDFRIQRGPFFVPILLFVLAAFVSLINSYDIVYSLDEIRGDLLAPIILYFVLINQGDKWKSIKKIYAGLFLSLVIVSVVGIYCYFNKTGIQPDGRALLVFPYPNTAGMYVAHLMVLLIGSYYVFPRTKTNLTILSVVMCISVFALFLTGSREGILSAAIGFVVFGVFINRRFLVAILLVFSMSVPFLPSVARDKVKTIFKSATYTNKKLQVYGRVVHWKTALRVISENPAFGVGFGWRNSSHAMTKMKNSKKFEIRDEILYHAHNTPLELAVEMGFLGVTAFLAFMFVGFRTFLEVKNKKPYNYPLFFSVTCSFVSVFVMGSVDFLLRYDQVYLVWLSIAIFTFFSQRDEVNNTLNTA